MVAEIGYRVLHGPLLPPDFGPVLGLTTMNMGGETPMQLKKLNGATFGPSDPA